MNTDNLVAPREGSEVGEDRMKRIARWSRSRWGSVLLASGLAVVTPACGGDGGEATGGGGGDGGGGQVVGPACPAEREAAIGPVDKVSDGEVTVLSDTGGVKTLYIDASAG